MSGPAQDMEEVVGDTRDIAAGWFARQRSGEMTPEGRAALRAWLEEDPAHRIAYLSVRRAWAGAGMVRGDPQVLEMRERWSRPAQEGLARRSIAAALAALVLAGGGYGGWRYATGPKPLKDEAFRTAVGEQRTLKLPDGSQVTLNTDSVLRTRADKDRRLIYLERGQAYFKVAHDRAHPFVVAAGGRTVTALGTAFDVRVDSGRFEVTLVEGKVRVEAPTPARPTAPGAANFQATEMTAGSRLVATAREPWRVAPANVVVETSWTRDILIFDDEPLSAVAAELNRYSDKKILIADAATGQTPISGTFRPGDVDSFVRTLEAYRLARAGENSKEAVRLETY
ncbi:MAG TPA: FecR domain-containing protein [Caulobacteraceae bacterium]